MQHALRAALDRRQPVGKRQNADDFAEPEGHNREVIAAHPQDGEAEQQPPERSRQHCKGQRRPKTHVRASQLARRGENAHRIRTKGKERHIPQVQQPRVADDDVQAQPHHHIQANHKDRLAQEKPDYPRQGKQEEDSQNRPSDGSLLLTFYGELAPLFFAHSAQLEIAGGKCQQKDNNSSGNIQRLIPKEELIQSSPKGLLNDLRHVFGKQAKPQHPNQSVYPSPAPTLRQQDEGGADKPHHRAEDDEEKIPDNQSLTKGDNF